MIRKKFRNLEIAALIVLILTAFTGVTFSQRVSQPDWGQASRIETVFAGEQKKALCDMRPGQAVRSGIAFKNQGEAPCFLRVKLCIPTMEGKEILEPGFLDLGAFREWEKKSWEPIQEYWICRGEYYYYKNEKTGDRLLPGRETTELYGAVRLNPESDLPKGMIYEIYAVIQAKTEDSEEWNGLK